MIAKVFLCSLLVAATCASPLTSTVNYGDAIEKFLDAFRKMAPLGCPSEKIPVLEPFVNQFSSFNYTRGETSIVGNASNIRISGLSNFLIISGDFDPNTYHATFDILYPEIQFLGSTIMEGIFNIFGFSIPTRQNSLLNERLEQLRFVGEYTFAQSLTNPNGLRLSELKVQFYVGDVKINNWDTLWNISGNDFYDRWSRETVAFLAQQVQPIMDQLIAQYVLPPLNEILSDLSMTDLTSLYVNLANQWNGGYCNVVA